MKWLYLAITALLMAGIAFAWEPPVTTGTAIVDGTINEFLSSSANKVSMIVPAMFLIIAIVAFALDFGAIGVTAGCIISLVCLSLLGIIAINVVSLTSLIVLGVILIFKLNG